MLVQVGGSTTVRWHFAHVAVITMLPALWLND